VLEPVQRTVGAPAHAVGEGIGNETPLEHRLDDLAERVVNHPVAERRGGAETALRFVDEEAGVGAGAIAPGAKFLLEGEEVLLQAVLKRGDAGVAAFAARGIVPRAEQVGPSANS
jgi:hypothetical protein